MLKEAGGDALRFDGAPYSPAQDVHAGIIGSSSTAVLAEVWSIFEALQMPLLAKPA